ncbi:MAG: hypothetical protein JRE28_16200 [Deltaproteobacteria bacterium]|nr:hypothetical protein [Deltaproteobacteria bacterium]
MRNKIPIERVVETFLSVPVHHESGKLRFTCPVCQGSDTSIHTKTNLARCFSCQRNFNPIEIVMHYLNINFVESVKWLKQRNAEEEKPITAINNKRQSQPSQIGDILSGIVPCISAEKALNPHPEATAERMSILEKKVDKIFLLIEELRSLITSK